MVFLKDKETWRLNVLCVRIWAGSELVRVRIECGMIQFSYYETIHLRLTIAIVNETRNLQVRTRANHRPLVYTYIDSGREHCRTFGETLESTKCYGKFRQLYSTTQLELRDYFATNAETLGNSWSQIGLLRHVWHLDVLLGVLCTPKQGSLLPCLSQCHLLECRLEEIIVRRTCVSQ